MKKKNAVEIKAKVQEPKWLTELKRLRELELESARIEKMNKKRAKREDS